ncbi:unnamed protein product [Prorocentrum cordatum]|uniref:RRM domain-containing protein n=1 Tax=Prorocentrum cordatum TaxID=2364126 RepID=A0ABN9W4G9_9DINO|nr:unnamed protein product [Polarella glacialis]
MSDSDAGDEEDETRVWGNMCALNKRSGAPQASRGAGRECEKGQHWQQTGPGMIESTSSATNQVYLGNLPCDVDWRDLKDRVTQAGSVEFRRVLTHDGAVYGRSFGCGQVRFSTQK